MELLVYLRESISLGVGLESFLFGGQRLIKINLKAINDVCNGKINILTLFSLCILFNPSIIGNFPCFCDSMIYEGVLQY